MCLCKRARLSKTVFPKEEIELCLNEPTAWQVSTTYWCHFGTNQSTLQITSSTGAQ
jgi:hypothetical protein